MVFSSLDTGLQTVLLYNYEVFIRLFWILLVVGISAIYLFYYKPYKEEKTPFFSVIIIRTLMISFSFISLILSPLMFLGLSPEINAWDYITPYFTIYTIMLLVYIIGLNWDLIRFGIPVILQKAGLDWEDEEVQLALRKYKGWLGNGKK